VIKGVGPGLYNVFPDAQNEMQEISALISEIMADTGQLNPATTNIEIANGEAEGIIAEAGAVAEQSILDKFPDIPVSLRQATESNYELT
jgi:division protein CdvB (Snf7/Vps24/ESCRT-III family)